MNGRMFEINNMLLELASKTKNQGVLSYNEIYNYLAYDKTEDVISDTEDINNAWQNLINKLDKQKGNTTFQRILPGWLTIKSKEFSSSIKSFKLYVNLPSQYIEKYSLKIFKFLDKKKIKHVSKISNSIRNDGLVIRLSDINDTREVIGYINKICDKIAIKTNPFTYRLQNVGVGYDGRSSYNAFISSIIASYLKDRNNTNSLETVSYGDFKSYSEELYKNYFINKKDLNILRHSSFYEDELNRLNREDLRYQEEEFLINVENMFKIFISSINENSNLNDVLGYILDIQDDKYTISKMDEFSKVLNSRLDKSNNDKLKELLDEYTKFAIKKYGAVQAKKQLNAFLYDTTKDRYMFITSENNFRQRFIENDMVNKVHTLIQNLDTYFDSINKLDYGLLSNILNSYIESVGKEEAIRNLMLLEEKGDYGIISDGYREQFINMDLVNNMKYITENNLVEYIDILFSNQNNESYKI